MTGATSDDYFDINDSNLEPELKHHIVDDLLNDQVQEVKNDRTYLEFEYQQLFQIDGKVESIETRI